MKKLRQVYEQEEVKRTRRNGDKEYPLNMISKSEIVTDPRQFRLDFKLQTDLSQIRDLEDTDTDLDYIFLGKSFTGRLHLFFGNYDPMQQIPTPRNLYPFSFVNWMIKNFQFYMSEGKPQLLDTNWKKHHIMIHGFGDYSPNIAFYRNNYEVIEFPDSGIVRVFPRLFGEQVNKVSLRMLDLLKGVRQIKREKIRELEKAIGSNNSFSC